MARFTHLGIEVEIQHSVGSDGAIVVQIDTEFEPDGSDDGPGLRVHINDESVYTGVELKIDAGLEDDLRMLRKWGGDR